jgi:hypothetical protein
MSAQGSNPDQVLRGSTDEKPVDSSVMTAIRQALHGLRFGQVVIVVQDGVVVQVDRTERTRLRLSSSSPRRTHSE